MRQVFPELLTHQSNRTPVWRDRAALAEWLSAYTVNGAQAVGHDEQTGSIEPGKAADVIVLDRNLFDIPLREVSKARVVLTLLDGREVHRDAEFGAKP